MSAEIVLWTNPRTIHFTIPAERRCEVAPGGDDEFRCPLPGRALMYWLTDDWSQLNNQIICAKHVLLVREIGGCLVFPLDDAPPPDVILPHVNAEIRRRRPPVQQVFHQVYWQPTGTTVWSNFNFGGSSYG